MCIVSALEIFREAGRLTLSDKFPRNTALNDNLYRPCDVFEYILFSCTGEVSGTYQQAAEESAMHLFRLVCTLRENSMARRG